jgi:hypothetical protein
MGCCTSKYDESKDVFITNLIEPRQILYNNVRNDMIIDTILNIKIDNFVRVFNRNKEDKLAYNAYIDKQIGILWDFIKYNQQIKKIYGVIKNNATGISKIHNNINNNYEFHHLTNDPIIHELIVNEVTRLYDGLTTMNNPITLIDNTFMENKIIEYTSNKNYLYGENNDILTCYKKYLLIANTDYMVKDIIRYMIDIYIHIIFDPIIMLTHRDIQNIILDIRLYGKKSIQPD